MIEHASLSGQGQEQRFHTYFKLLVRTFKECLWGRQLIKRHSSNCCICDIRFSKGLFEAKYLTGRLLTVNPSIGLTRSLVYHIYMESSETWTQGFESDIDKVVIDYWSSDAYSEIRLRSLAFFVFSIFQTPFCEAYYSTKFVKM